MEAVTFLQNHKAMCESYHMCEGCPNCGAKMEEEGRPVFMEILFCAFLTGLCALTLLCVFRCCV